MNTIGIHEQGEIDAVIHDEQGIVRSAELRQLLCLLKPQAIGSVFAPVLHQGDA